MLHNVNWSALTLENADRNKQLKAHVKKNLQMNDVSVTERTLNFGLIIRTAIFISNL